MTEIERIRERISKALSVMQKDVERLFEIIEERGTIIDELARKVERLEERGND